MSLQMIWSEKLGPSGNMVSYCKTCKEETEWHTVGNGGQFCLACGCRPGYDPHVTERPTCKTCPYYDPTAETRVYDVGTYDTFTYNHNSPRKVIGVCKRRSHAGPHSKPDDWCGQHPDFPVYIAGLKKS